MRYFLYTNTPDGPVTCEAVWLSRDDAIEGLKSLKCLDYFCVYRGQWTNGILPRVSTLTPVHISELLPNY